MMHIIQSIAADLFQSLLRLESHICINTVMPRSKSYKLPTTTAMTAFECAVRRGSFAGAAKELGTSQPAVSRHIASLEQQLGTKLFERSRTGVKLTPAGRQFHDGVSAGLGIIRSAANEATAPSTGEQVVIACSMAASQYVVMPRYDALRDALGHQTLIRVLIFYLNARNLPLEPVADVVLDWKPYGRAGDHAVLFREAVRPVCSPAFAEAHADTLNGPVSGWSGLTFLEPDLASSGSASWEDWFEAAGRPELAPRFLGFDNYVYSLEAAVGGQGIALGWRNFVDRHLETGALVALGDGYVELENFYCGILTQQGRLRPIAQKCLSFFRGDAPAQDEEPWAPLGDEDDL